MTPSIINTYTLTDNDTPAIDSPLHGCSKDNGGIPNEKNPENEAMGPGNLCQRGEAGAERRYFGQSKMTK